MRRNKIVDDLITNYGVEALKEIFTDFGDCESLEYFIETVGEYNEWARQYTEDKDEVLMKAYTVIPQEDMEYLYEIGELVDYRIIQTIKGYEELSELNMRLLLYRREYESNYFKRNNIQI